jgi:uncharacterized iron-regulated membrane protein
MAKASTATDRAASGGPVQGPLYRLIWRWHFYAGLICLPFLVMMAATGLLYLFRDELSLVLERDRLIAPPSVAAEAPRPSPEALIAAALARQPGEAIRFTPPPASGRTAEVGVHAGPETISVFLDPATGRVLDIVPQDMRPMTFISHIHSLAVLGDGPNLLIEIVGGWAILLVASGLYLWWPRGQSGGVVTIRASPSRRLWWRDIHAVTGVMVGGVLLFLAVTGMPWANYWGKQYRNAINDWGLGAPASVKATSVASDAALAASKSGSWTMDGTAAPASAPLDQRLSAATLPIARIMAIGQARGLAPGYVVRLPTSPGGVFTLQLYPRQATGQRVIHIDRYSGKVLADVGFADYGPMAKATEYAIAIHTGGQLGRANQVILALACLAIIGLGLAGAVAWWKRRPSGGLGAPPADRAGRTPLGLSLFALFAVALGALFPLLGLSLVVAFVIDRVAAALSARRATA